MATILVIDDSISALTAVDVILRTAGYQVRCCRDGKEALALLEKEPFDLILTDIYMPDEDGLAVIRARRRICPAVPVVAMSGVTGIGNMLAAARYMGACQTLEKPFSDKELLRAVAGALEIRRKTELPA